jgi:predicted HTH domain antitoxin
MHVLNIPYNDDLLLATGKTPAELEPEMQFLLAVKLFELGRLSLGKAAEFCGLSKTRFMDRLGELKIPVINLAEDQIADELRDD